MIERSSFDFENSPSISYIPHGQNPPLDKVERGVNEYGAPMLFFNSPEIEIPEIGFTYMNGENGCGYTEESMGFTFQEGQLIVGSAVDFMRNGYLEANIFMIGPGRDFFSILCAMNYGGFVLTTPLEYNEDIDLKKTN
jgi:hypothetical protein